MEKARLLELVKQHNDKEAIGMILSNFTDYGHTEKGGMISVGQFYKVAECLIEWWAGKNKPSEKEVLTLYNVRQRILGWWETLPENMNGENSKYQLAYKYYDKHWMSLTYREIESIYGQYVA